MANEENELKESKGASDELQQLAQMGVWELDSVKNEIFLYRDMCDIFEIDLKKFNTTYEAYMSQIHPEDREMVDRAYTDFVKNKNHHEIVYRLLMPDGRIKSIRENCKTIYNHTDAPPRFIGIVLNITGRIETEKKLEERSVMLQVTLEAIEDGIVFIDFRGKIVQYNEKFVKIWGIPESFLKSLIESEKGYLPLLNSMQELKELREFISKINEFSGNFIDQVSDVIKFRGGTIFERVSKPHKAKDGTIGRIWDFRDITKIKSAEIELEKRNQFLNIVMDSLTYPFYVLDINSYEILLSNRMTGTETKGKKCYQVSHHRDKPCDDEKNPCPLKEVVKNKKPAIVEHIHYSDKNEKKDVEVHFFPIFNEKGDADKIIEYSIDITERKEIEKTMKDRNEELEKFKKIAVGRELRMIELKKKISELEGNLANKNTTNG